MIALAYGVDFSQIVGAPQWVQDHFYDIEGKGPAGDEKQCKLMLQGLLADRFNLIAHWDENPISVLALVVAKGGPKLKRVAPEDQQPNGPGFTVNGAPVAMYSPQLKGWSMEQLVHALNITAITQLGERVVDLTGLDGIYKVSLRFTQDGRQGPAPDVRTALHEQLGLALENRKVPVERIVIDKIRMPDPN